MYKNLHIPLLMLAAAAMIIAGCKKKMRTWHSLKNLKKLTSSVTVTLGPKTTA